MYPNNNYDPKAASQAVGKWSSGLCDCCKDPSICCLTFWCPCVTFGRIAEITDRGDTSCFLGGLIYLVISRVRCQCLYTRIFRSKLRGFYSLPEDPCGDCCVHCWCGPCALCQEYRELTARGMEPANGWMANADKMNAAAPTTPPSVAPTMNR